MADVSSARERAREDAEVAADSPLWREGETVASKCADAVSDIWEPLLRDLLVAYEHAVEYEGKGHTTDVTSIFAWGGYTRAKEALDE